MGSVRNIKVGKLIECRVFMDGNVYPGVVKKVADRADGHVDAKIVIPRRFAGRYQFIDGSAKAEAEEIIIKHKGFKLHE